MSTARRPSSTKAIRPQRSGEGPGGCATTIGRALAIGLIVAILGAALAAASFVLPVIASLQEGTDASPSASATPAPGQPLLAAPAAAVVADKRVDIFGTLPKDLLGREGALIRILVTRANGSPTVGGEIAVPSTPDFKVPGVALGSGVNTIVAVIVEGGTEGARSNEISIERDNTAPDIALSEPESGATIGGADVSVVGKTDPNIDVVVRNDTTGTIESGRSSSKGAFSLTVRLRSGTNRLTVTAADAAGNATERRLEITTSAAAGLVTIDVNPQTLYVGGTSTSFRFTARAVDAAGSPIVNVCVEFIVETPPSSNWTDACVRSDANGRASFTVTPSISKSNVGRGLVTVTYHLDVGDPMSASARIYIKEKP